jgi:hypothetical protein
MALKPEKIVMDSGLPCEANFPIPICVRVQVQVRDIRIGCRPTHVRHH